jgi:hypothetical protein
VALILAVAAALARPPELGTELVDVVVTDAFQAVEIRVDGCVATPRPGPPLPVGLRVKAKLAYDSCGGRYAYVVSPTELGAPRTTFWHTPIEGLSAEPARRSPWEDGAVTGTGFTAVGNEGFVLGHPVDGGVEPVWLPVGVPVEVLAADVAVVRLPWGPVVAVDPMRVVTEDPLLDERSEARRALRRRLVEGLSTHAPVAPLGAPVDGRSYLVELRRADLTLERTFSPDWLDPVGQVARATCDRPASFREPRLCGAFYLDYAELGAWWPTEASVDVIAIADGTQDGLPRLRVVVRDPTGGGIGVTAAWDPP